MKLYLYYKELSIEGRPEKYRSWTVSEKPWSDELKKEHKEFTGPFEVEVNV